MTVTDVDGTYTDDESRAQLIERTAKAIYQADVFGPGGPLAASLAELWNAETSTNRIRYRNQARAALGASELLKRIEELEQQITQAKSAVLSALDQPSHRSMRARQDMRNAVRALGGDGLVT